MTDDGITTNTKLRDYWPTGIMFLIAGMIAFFQHKNTPVTHYCPPPASAKTEISIISEQNYNVHPFSLQVGNAPAVLPYKCIDEKNLIKTEFIPECDSEIQKARTLTTPIRVTGLDFDDMIGTYLVQAKAEGKTALEFTAADDQKLIVPIDAELTFRPSMSLLELEAIADSPYEIIASLENGSELYLDGVIGVEAVKSNYIGMPRIHQDIKFKRNTLDRLIEQYGVMNEKTISLAAIVPSDAKYVRVSSSDGRYTDFRKDWLPYVNLVSNGEGYDIQPVKGKTIGKRSRIKNVRFVGYH